MSDRYENGTKETSRGWTWNRVCEFIPPVYRAESLVIYLPGTDDFDRRLAISKGFSNDNLIAVDKSLESIEMVRSNGGIGINANLDEVLDLWPLRIRVDAILADLTCGFTDSVSLLFWKMMHHIGDGGTVVSVNLMRGRDIKGGCYSQFIKEHCSEEQKMDAHVNYGIEDVTKHRGFQVLCEHISIGASREAANFKLNDAEEIELKRIMHHHARAKLYSYRSNDGGMYFDSLCLRSFASKINELRARSSESRRRKVLAKQKYRKLNQRIAAAMAVRTKMQRNRRCGLVRESQQCEALQNAFYAVGRRATAEYLSRRHDS